MEIIFEVLQEIINQKHGINNINVMQIFNIKNTIAEKFLEIFTFSFI